MSKRSITVPLVSLAMIFVASGAFAVNSLDVNATAALGGSNFGLEVLTDGSSTGVFVADTSPLDETVYRAEFRINHNNITMAAGTSHAVLLGRSVNPGVVNNLRVFLKLIGTDYKVTVRAKKDGAGAANCGKTTFGGPGLRIGVELVQASAGMTNGECRLFRNGVEVFNRTDLDNETLQIDAVRFGAPDGVSGTTTGSFYLDDFSSFRTLAP